MARIKELIASGQYKPGQRLPTEQEMAARFGVGRSSIREALKVFQHLGVVESKAAKGTFVCDRANISVEAITWALLLGDDDLRDVFELRSVIERSCFRRLVRGYHDGAEDAAAAVAQLEEQVGAMRAAAAASDLWALVEADYRFHEVIINAGGNDLFSAMFRTLQSFMREEIFQSYRRMTDLDEVADDHAEMVQVMRTGAADVAIERHRSHFVRIEGLLDLEHRRIDVG